MNLVVLSMRIIFNGEKKSDNYVAHNLNMGREEEEAAIQEWDAKEKEKKMPPQTANSMFSLLNKGIVSGVRQQAGQNAFGLQSYYWQPNLPQFKGLAGNLYLILSVLENWKLEIMCPDDN